MAFEDIDKVYYNTIIKKQYCVNGYEKLKNYYRCSFPQQENLPPCTFVGTLEDVTDHVCLHTGTYRIICKLCEKRFGSEAAFFHHREEFKCASEVYGHLKWTDHEHRLHRRVVNIWVQQISREQFMILRSEKWKYQPRTPKNVLSVSKITWVSILEESPQDGAPQIPNTAQKTSSKHVHDRSKSSPARQLKDPPDRIPERLPIPDRNGGKTTSTHQNISASMTVPQKEEDLKAEWKLLKASPRKVRFAESEDHRESMVKVDKKEEYDEEGFKPNEASDVNGRNGIGVHASREQDPAPQLLTPSHSETSKKDTMDDGSPIPEFDPSIPPPVTPTKQVQKPTTKAPKPKTLNPKPGVVFNLDGPCGRKIAKSRRSTEDSRSSTESVPSGLGKKRSELSVQPQSVKIPPLPSPNQPPGLLPRFSTSPLDDIPLPSPDFGPPDSDYSSRSSPPDQISQKRQRSPSRQQPQAPSRRDTGMERGRSTDRREEPVSDDSRESSPKRARTQNPRDSSARRDIHRPTPLKLQRRDSDMDIEEDDDSNVTQYSNASSPLEIVFDSRWKKAPGSSPAAKSTGSVGQSSGPLRLSIGPPGNFEKPNGIPYSIPAQRRSPSSALNSPEPVPPPPRPFEIQSRSTSRAVNASGSNRMAHLLTPPDQYVNWKKGQNDASNVQK